MNAERLALPPADQTRVRLDRAIETKRHAGIDMPHKATEPNQGREAANLVECRAAIDKGAAGGKLRV